MSLELVTNGNTCVSMTYCRIFSLPKIYKQHQDEIMKFKGEITANSPLSINISNFRFQMIKICLKVTTRYDFQAYINFPTRYKLFLIRMLQGFKGDIPYEPRREGFSRTPKMEIERFVTLCSLLCEHQRNADAPDG